MPLAYAWQKTYEAVFTLAAADLPLRQRVHDALVWLAQARAEDFPETARPAFRQIEAAMTGEGSIDASLAAMDAQELRRVIEAVLSLYRRVAREAELPESLE